jgi:hypothetical protein
MPAHSAGQDDVVVLASSGEEFDVSSGCLTVPAHSARQDDMAI